MRFRTIFVVWVAWVLLGSALAQGQTHLDSALLSAAEKGDVQKIRELLAAGANVNAKIWLKYTPLHAACGRGNLESVQVLIAAGADINAQNMYQGRLTPLGVVAATTRVEIARELISAEADVEKGGLTPLLVAAQHGRGEMIRILVEAGARVNPVGKQPPLHRARLADSARALIELGAEVDFKNKDGKTALHRTAGSFSPELEAVAVLIKARANVNARANDGSTPLICSIRDKKLEIVRQLIASGARLDVKDDAGNTPLSMASKAGEKFVQVLVDAGAKDDGKTPLQRAAEKGNVEAIRKLVVAGAAVNETGPQRITALHLAAQAGSAPCVQVLLAKGANPKAKTDQEITALHVAKTAEVAELLLAAGAPLDPKTPRDSPLCMAAVNGRTEVVRYLLKYGADPYNPLPGVLAVATFVGQLEVVEAMLSHGVLPDFGDLEADSALQVACNGAIGDVRSPSNVTLELRLKLAQALVRAGANPNKYRTYPLLYFPAVSGDLEIVRFLLDNGANVNDTNAIVAAGFTRGETALHGAAKAGNIAVVQLLVERGANVNAVTDSNHYRGRQTPLDLTKSEEVRSFLVSQGGKPVGF